MSKVSRWDPPFVEGEAPLQNKYKFPKEGTRNEDLLRWRDPVAIYSTEKCVGEKNAMLCIREYHCNRKNRPL
jgi:hypothetical protein